jgi:hypothetical protein
MTTNSSESLTSSIALLSDGADAWVDSIANDRLDGAKAIGDFLGEDEKKIYYWAERKLIPIGRIGSMLVGSKKVLKEHYERITRGEAEPQPPHPTAQPSGRRHLTKPPAPRRARPRRKREDLPAEAAPTS